MLSLQEVESFFELLLDILDEEGEEMHEEKAGDGEEQSEGQSVSERYKGRSEATVREGLTFREFEMEELKEKGEVDTNFELKWPLISDILFIITILI
jgi:hypothetical protein